MWPMSQTQKRESMAPSTGLLEFMEQRVQDPPSTDPDGRYLAASQMLQVPLSALRV